MPLASKFQRRHLNFCGLSKKMHPTLYSAFYIVGPWKILTIIDYVRFSFALQVVNIIRSRFITRMLYTWLSSIKKAN